MTKRVSRGPAGKLRIIGGRWRGRRFPGPPGDRTRPTGDRIRETVFNWLAPVIDGTLCLDLFAGSGALGFEALSRGATGAVFVERDACAADRIVATLGELECVDADVITGDALQFLAGTPKAFDIVFLDPPFGNIDMENLCTLLDNGWLARGAVVYIEIRRGDAAPQLPPGWEVIRDKTAGQVRFMLVRRSGD